ncbi:MAG: alpha-ketoglutarate-dependent dioxygenase AlkB [Acidimicrobiia bacterium]|nr:alpha-ketoglutarate-dependent dioxygenase AlkB [Acidimicrobiia bacterium]
MRGATVAHVSIDSSTISFERLQLDDRSWVDVARGFLDSIGHDTTGVYDAVEGNAPWQQGRVFRYERWVDEPRLAASYGRGTPAPHPAVTETQRLLQHHYHVQFGGYGLAYYRNERDMMALHRDRDMRWLDETIIALLVLGARRPFHLRPRGNRYDHEAEYKGAVHDVAPGEGDLIVMGGACQAGWEHGVPRPDRATGGRISVQWRWTSRRGRPVVGASYGAPRLYSR